MYLRSCPNNPYTRTYERVQDPLHVPTRVSYTLYPRTYERAHDPRTYLRTCTKRPYVRSCVRPSCIPTLRLALLPKLDWYLLLHSPVLPRLVLCLPSEHYLGVVQATPYTRTYERDQDHPHVPTHVYKTTYVQPCVRPLVYLHYY